MHTSYTVGITTGEYKALQTVMVNPQEWIQTSITNLGYEPRNSLSAYNFLFL